ncbi:MAG: hypothetical protein WCS77_06185 [Elusimicrobiaceae bacterium]
MEQPDSKKTGLTPGNIVLGIAVTALLILIARYSFSDANRALRAGKPVHVVILANPPAWTEINPANGKVTIKYVSESAEMKNRPLPERAEAVKTALLPDSGEKVLYFASALPREKVWENAGETARAYRENPFLAAAYAKNYLLALFNGQTNIGPEEFYALTMALMRSDPGNYIAVLPDGALISSDVPSANEVSAPVFSGKTLVLEILNGTAKSGMALIATRYIRSLSTKELPLDVLRHDGAPQRTEKSYFISHTGRNDDIAVLSARLGLTEVKIIPSKRPAPDIDASLVAGDDFKVPDSK